MITAIIPDEPVEYRCKEDKEDPTVWKLRNLTIRQEQYLMKLALNLTQGEKNREERTLENMNVCLNLCLLGADNFKNSKGQDAVWNRDESKPDVYQGIKPWTEDTLQQIPYETREELYIFIVSGYRGIKGEDSKNS